MILLFKFYDLLDSLLTPENWCLFNKNSSFYSFRTGIIPLRSVEGRTVKSNSVYEFRNLIYPPYARKITFIRQRMRIFDFSEQNRTVAVFWGPDGKIWHHIGILRPPLPPYIREITLVQKNTALYKHVNEKIINVSRFKFRLWWIISSFHCILMTSLLENPEEFKTWPEKNDRRVLR